MRNLSVFLAIACALWPEPSAAADRVRIGTGVRPLIMAGSRGKTSLNHLLCGGLPLPDGPRHRYDRPNRTGSRRLPHCPGSFSKTPGSRSPQPPHRPSTTAYRPRLYQSRSINNSPQPGQYVLSRLGSCTFPM